MATSKRGAGGWGYAADTSPVNKVPTEGSPDKCKYGIYGVRFSGHENYCGGCAADKAEREALVAEIRSKNLITKESENEESI